MDINYSSAPLMFTTIEAHEVLVSKTFLAQQKLYYKYYSKSNISMSAQSADTSGYGHLSWHQSEMVLINAVINTLCLVTVAANGLKAVYVAHDLGRVCGFVSNSLRGSEQVMQAMHY